MSDTQVTPDHLAEIAAMNYQQMLDAWMSGAPYLVDGSEEKKAFDARFQQLRAELQPEESSSTSTDRSNKKRGGKKGNYRGRK
jgi:hypothetical protein